MNDKTPSTAREALLAELLGDAHTILEKMEAMRTSMDAADERVKLTVTTIETATSNYRAAINEIASRLRLETASIINQTTEHAARSLVGQQTNTLRLAATDAIRDALNADILRRSKRDWLLCVLVAAATGGVVSLAISLMFR